MRDGGKQSLGLNWAKSFIDLFIMTAAPQSINYWIDLSFIYSMAFCYCSTEVKDTSKHKMITLNTNIEIR